MTMMTTMSMRRAVEPRPTREPSRPARHDRTMGPIHQLGGLALLLCLTACGSSRGKPDDGLDIAVDGEQTGMRGTTSVDGEELVVETRVIVEPGQTQDGKPRDDEILLATVTGDDAAPYADWRLHILSDRLTGSFAGRSFERQDRGRRAEDGDWAELASSRTGAVLTAVSQRAAAVMAGGELAAMEQHLFTVSDMGPYLQALPSIIDGLETVCGDGECKVDENDENCPEDCGCAASSATCGGVAPFGCYCSEDCAANGDCCADSCPTCGAGCPPCGDAVPCDRSCATVLNTCDGAPDCASGEDEARCHGGACRAGQVACDSGACIEFYQFCDGSADCPGGEDELCECAYCGPG